MSVKREREVLWRSVSEYHVSSAPLREVCALHVNAARFRMCVAHSRAARCHDGQYGPLDQSRAGLTFVGYVLSTSSSPKNLLRGMPHRDQRHVSFAAIALTRHRAPCDYPYSFAIELAVKAARRAVSARLCTDVCRCLPGRPPYGTTSLRTCVCAQIFE